MNILYQCNDKYAPYCGISVTSLFENNKAAAEIIVYILDDGICDENKRRLTCLADEYKRNIVFINTDSIVKKMIEMGIPKYRGSYTTNMKLFVADYLPDSAERVLYIDSDTIVCGSLEELFSGDFGEYALKMSYDSLVRGYKEMLGMKKDAAYYNAGVILFNMQQWKKLDCAEKIIEHIKTVRAHYSAPDQDFINVVLGNYIQALPPKYNYQPVYKLMTTDKYLRMFGGVFYDKQTLEESGADIRIVHFFRFMGEFPWHKDNMHPFSDLFDKYTAISPWADYEKKPAENSTVFSFEKLLYKVLPRGLFMRLFKLSHELFMKKSDKLSRKNQNNKLM